MKEALRICQKAIFFSIGYIFIVGSFTYAGSLLTGIDLDKSATQSISMAGLFLKIFELAGTLLTIWIFMKYVNKERLPAIRLKSGVRKEILFGILTSLAIMLAGFSILLLCRQIEVSAINFNVANLLLSIGIFICIAITEEALVRGYILRKLMRHYNKWTALIISSVIFSLMHILNPHITAISIVNLFLAGIILGLPFIFTGNLWCSIAFHFGWNFFQSLFGFPVSGTNFQSVVIQKHQINNLWTGASFGFEGSVICILFQILTIAFFYYRYKKKLTTIPVIAPSTVLSN